MTPSRSKIWPEPHVVWLAVDFWLRFTSMSEMVVRCPKCAKGLKLRDRSKIGKKARCPKCSHVFVLTAPPEPVQDEDEVELKLASEAASQPAPQSDAPAVGVAARWVPDNSSPLEQAAPQPAVPQQVVPQQAGPAAAGPAAAGPAADSSSLGSARSDVRKSSYWPRCRRTGRRRWSSTPEGTQEEKCKTKKHGHHCRWF